VELLEYVLDMGPVLKGYTETRTLKITNPGQIPVSFQANVSVLQDTGFSVDPDQKNGLPPNHTVAFDVRFESAHRPQGDVEVVLPIEVTQGPTYNICLRATVLELSLSLSKKRLQFSDILVGHCQVETIRLYNQFRVPCKWFITASKPVLKSLVKMTGNPISRAVMRHLGIDPSSGRCEAQQHRGIVVIVHGPPRAGKTEIAAGLCQYYDAAYVSIGTVVEEAMANDRSPAGLCARELCTKAAKELKDKDEGDA
ncbi:hydrocephalus-inducing protein homolog, partial [Passer montanus]|uniref:hydrocephalus-inducing protein homolog n=1 Tax=Passer montanus TaxID=9160 RepID=UPI00195F3F6C